MKIHRGWLAYWSAAILFAVATWIESGNVYNVFYVLAIFAAGCAIVYGANWVSDS